MRFRSIEGLRALAAVSVLITHVSFISNENGREPFGRYFARLDVGVSIFFVISGFLLWRSVSASLLAGRPLPAVGPYVLRRAARIFPAYWVALAAALVVDPGPLPGMADLVAYAGLVHIYQPSTVIGIGPISQAWSLGTEISFYLFVPVLGVVLARLGRGATDERARARLQAAALAALWAASLLLRWAVAVAEPAEQGMYTTWLPLNLDLFAYGMVLALVWNRAGARADALMGRPGAAEASLLAALVSLWLVANHIGLPVDSLTYSVGAQVGRQLLYGAVALFLVLPCVLGRDGPGPLRAVLRSRWATWAGLISYGIYLWQNVALEVYREQRGLQPFQGWFPSTLGAVLLATVVLAAASWYLVERPVIGLARRGRPARG